MDQLLFEKHPSPMLIYDLDTLKILDGNTAFTEKYLYSTEEIERRELTIEQIRPKEEVSALLNVIGDLKQSGLNDSGIHRHQAKNGKNFYVKITSHELEYKGKRARLVNIHDITRQVEAEKKSTTAYQELQHHIQNSPLASVKWDKDFRIKEWSSQAENISGYSEKEVIGKSLFSINLFEQTELDHIKLNIEDLVQGMHDSNQFETKVKHKSGRQLYIRVYSSALRDNQNDLYSVLTLVEDITSQKKSEIKYQRLFENANDSILLIKNSCFVDCNKKAEDLYKASRNEIVGKRPVDFSPDRQPDGSCSEKESQKRMRKALKDGSNIFEWQHKTTEGDLINVEVSLNKIVFPDGEIIQAIVRDITDKKETHAKLRKNEEMFRNLFLKSPAALVMVNVNDRIEVVNESFEKMFGYSLDEVRGRDIDELVVPKNGNNKTPKMKDNFTEDFQVEGVRLTKDGRYKHVIIAGMPVNIDGEPIAGFGMYIDITEGRKSEQQLKKSLEEKQFLLEEIHHRVKNNLAIISGLLELEAMNWEEESAVQKVIKQSKLRIKSMAMIHEKLYQSGSFSNLKLGNYIAELMESIYDTMGGDEKNVTIDIESDDIQLNINQAISCAMIINELATNSFKYAYENTADGRLTIKLKHKDDNIFILIRDNGPGLPENFEGMVPISLGHQLVNQLVKQLQGDINVQSQKGDGVQYKITFKKREKSGSSSSGKLNDQD